MDGEVQDLKMVTKVGGWKGSETGRACSRPGQSWTQFSRLRQTLSHSLARPSHCQGRFMFKTCRTPSQSQDRVVDEH